MRAAAVAAALSVTVTAQTTFPESTPVTGNPSSVKYRATLPDTPFFSQAALSGNVQGHIVAAAAPDGVGVKFDVHLKNFPASGGPFLYHIHVEPVPAGGNCTATLTHLDPLNRGEIPPCDESAPATCQVGDLSGKHGKPAKDPFHAVYIDPFVSLKPDDAAFMGNRSFVVHFANKTRITCANFVAINQEYDPDECPADVAPSVSAMPSGVAKGTTGVSVPSAGASNQSIVPITASATTNDVSLPLMVTMAMAMTGLWFALC